jgi:periplasmic divalent cation tolerance protein
MGIGHGHRAQRPRLRQNLLVFQPLMQSWQPAPESLLVVSTTVADGDGARRLARLALQARLAACVQVAAIDSHYIWEGVLTEEPELRLWFKTSVAAYRGLERLLMKHHPYALPMITAEPLLAVSEDYRAWVLQALTPPPEDQDRGSAVVS